MMASFLNHVGEVARLEQMALNKFFAETIEIKYGDVSAVIFGLDLDDETIGLQHFGEIWTNGGLFPKSERFVVGRDIHAPRQWRFGAKPHLRFVRSAFIGVNEASVSDDDGWYSRIAPNDQPGRLAMTCVSRLREGADQYAGGIVHRVDGGLGDPMIVGLMLAGCVRRKKIEARKSARVVLDGRAGTKVLRENRSADDCNGAQNYCSHPVILLPIRPSGYRLDGSPVARYRTCASRGHGNKVSDHNYEVAHVDA